MQVLTRVSPWHRTLAPVRSRSIQQRRLNPATRLHHTRNGCVIRSQTARGISRQTIPRLSHLCSTYTLRSRSRYCSSAHMDSLTTQRSSDEYRLPTNVKPTHYDITIKTDLQNQVFEGFVRIELVFSVFSSWPYTHFICSLDVKELTSRIILNTSDLVLGTAYISFFSLFIDLRLIQW